MASFEFKSKLNLKLNCNSELLFSDAQKGHLIKYVLEVFAADHILDPMEKQFLQGSQAIAADG